MFHLCVCIDLLHDVSLSKINAVERNVVITVTHTFPGNETEFADRSKRICITLGSSFCRLLAWNWEVSTGRSLNIVFVFSQVAQHLVISSYIEILKEVFLFGKTALRVFTRYFEEIVGKNLFACFIYVFDSICCSLCHS